MGKLFPILQIFLPNADIDTDYVAISIRAHLNRFALALATTRNDEGFSMMTTTFLL